MRMIRSRYIRARILLGSRSRKVRDWEKCLKKAREGEEGVSGEIRALTAYIKKIPFHLGESVAS